MVRGKFRVTKIADTCYSGGKEVTLSAEYDNTLEEDRRFAKATPSASITMFIDNPPALEQLKLGGYFYVDFSEVPKKEEAAA